MKIAQLSKLNYIKNHQTTFETDYRTLSNLVRKYAYPNSYQYSTLVPRYEYPYIGPFCATLMVER